MKINFLLILLTIHVSLFSLELNEFRGKSITFLTDSTKTQISKQMNFSEKLVTRLDRDLKAITDKNNNLKIVILKDKQSFDSYLNELTIEPREDFTYAMFKNSERNRVITYLNSDRELISLAHHLTLYYVDRYFNSSPYWLKIGLATYYEDFSTEGIIVKNNKWITTLKNQNSNYFTSLLLLEDKDIRQDLSWLLVDFFYNSKNVEDSRFFWDSLSYLKWSGDNNREENLIRSFKKYNLDIKLTDYIKTLMGYNEYMDQGINNYNAGNYKLATVSFNEAINKESGNYSPYYYLGLTHNKEKKYKKAYSSFSKALDRGAPKDITYYSIGLNFYSSKDFKQALNYLEQIKKGESSTYDLAQKMINEIKKY